MIVIDLLLFKILHYLLKCDARIYHFEQESNAHFNFYLYSNLIILK